MKLELYFGTLLIYTAFGSSINGPCEKDEHCGTLDSHCRNGICVCVDNFLVHEDSCIQVLQPPASCVKNADCYPVKGSRSMCKEETCACIPFHHEHNGLCIKNRGLHERCENDHQCYWGQNMESRMGCVGGLCSCKPGFIPHNNRKCISGAARHFSAVTYLSVFSLFLIHKLY